MYWARAALNAPAFLYLTCAQRRKPQPTLSSVADKLTLVSESKKSRRDSQAS